MCSCISTANTCVYTCLCMYVVVGWPKIILTLLGPRCPTCPPSHTISFLPGQSSPGKWQTYPEVMSCMSFWVLSKEGSSANWRSLVLLPFIWWHPPCQFQIHQWECETQKTWWGTQTEVLGSRSIASIWQPTIGLSDLHKFLDVVAAGNMCNPPSCWSSVK